MAWYLLKCFGKISKKKRGIGGANLDSCESG